MHSSSSNGKRDAAAAANCSSREGEEELQYNYHHDEIDSMCDNKGNPWSVWQQLARNLAVVVVPSVETGSGSPSQYHHHHHAVSAAHGVGVTDDNEMDVDTEVHQQKWTGDDDWWRSDSDDDGGGGGESQSQFPLIPSSLGECTARQNTFSVATTSSGIATRKVEQGQRNDEILTLGQEGENDNDVEMAGLVEIEMEFDDIEEEKEADAADAHKVVPKSILSRKKGTTTTTAALFPRSGNGENTSMVRKRVHFQLPDEGDGNEKAVDGVDEVELCLDDENEEEEEEEYVHQTIRNTNNSSDMNVMQYQVDAAALSTGTSSTSTAEVLPPHFLTAASAAEHEDMDIVMEWDDVKEQLCTTTAHEIECDVEIVDEEENDDGGGDGGGGGGGGSEQQHHTWDDLLGMDIQYDDDDDDNYYDDDENEDIWQEDHQNERQHQQQLKELQASSDRIRTAALAEWNAQQRAGAVGTRLLRPALTTALINRQKQPNNENSSVLLSTLLGAAALTLRGSSSSSTAGTTTASFQTGLSVLLSIVHSTNTATAAARKNENENEIDEVTRIAAASGLPAGPLRLKAVSHHKDVLITW